MAPAAITYLDFAIREWLSGDDGDAVRSVTLGALEVLVGPQSVPLTEVEDTIARTVRRHIHVAVYPLAEWLLINWWRLRWEPRRTSFEWRQAHSMASISSDYAWPALEFSSDGALINLHTEAESAPDVAAIRYLRSVHVDIPAADFERAVERLIGVVLERLHVCGAREHNLDELWKELQDERSDPEQAALCKAQALAGLDPGEADEQWLRALAEVRKEAGTVATDEVLAVLPDLPNGFMTARETIDALRHAPTTVDLSWVGEETASPGPDELPWQRGERLAAEVRARLGLDSGPIDSDRLGELLHIHLPCDDPGNIRKQPLSGGYRNGIGPAKTRTFVPSRRPESQRFYLARLIGGALASSPDQRLLPVTHVYTAFQKYARAFAREFLCPWPALDAFTEENGLDDEGITEAAAYFQVSELLITSTLVNKGKLSRGALHDYQGA